MGRSKLGMKLLITQVNLIMIGLYGLIVIIIIEHTLQLRLFALKGRKVEYKRTAMTDLQ